MLSNPHNTPFCIWNFLSSDIPDDLVCFEKSPDESTFFQIFSIGNFNSSYFIVDAPKTPLVECPAIIFFAQLHLVKPLYMAYISDKWWKWHLLHFTSKENAWKDFLLTDKRIRYSLALRLTLKLKIFSLNTNHDPIPYMISYMNILLSWLRKQDFFNWFILILQQIFDIQPIYT